MTVRITIPHREIIKAVLEVIDNNTDLNIPADAVVNIVDIGAGAFEVAIRFDTDLP